MLLPGAIAVDFFTRNQRKMLRAREPMAPGMKPPTAPKASPAVKPSMNCRKTEASFRNAASRSLTIIPERMPRMERAPMESPIETAPTRAPATIP